MATLFNTFLTLVATLFLLYINHIPYDVICNIAIYVDDTSVYPKCDQASDRWQQLELASELWQQLQLASELESNLWVTGLVQKVACWFQYWKNSVLTDLPNNTGAIDEKMDRSVFEEKSSFKMLWLTFSSKLD